MMFFYEDLPSKLLTGLQKGIRIHYEILGRSLVSLFKYPWCDLEIIKLAYFFFRMQKHESSY